MEYQEQSLGGQIFNRIRDDILSGNYAPGEELKEAQEKAGAFKDKLDGMADTAVTAAKALGAGFVAAATYATKFETDCDKALNTVITQIGAADAEVEGLEETLLSIYKDNFGEDINDIALAMSAVKQQTGQTGKELKNTTENAILMRDTFDIDVNESIRGVNAMMKQFGISYLQSLHRLWLQPKSYLVVSY